MRMIIMLLSIIFVGCSWYVQEDVPTRALENAGFTDIQCGEKNFITPSWSGCSSSDGVAFKCVATNPVGKRVRVTVCASGWLKSATIRYD